MLIIYIPSHSHFILHDGACTVYGSRTARSDEAPYIPNQCYYYWPSDDQYNYYSWNMDSFGTSSEPNVSPTGNTGSGQSFEVYQPTLIIGNLFIYAGET